MRPHCAGQSATHRQATQRLLDRDGFVCGCPRCGLALNNEAVVGTDDNDTAAWACGACGLVSTWRFGVAPMPLLEMKA
jgi:transcription elongation factor Elf1